MKYIDDLKMLKHHINSECPVADILLSYSNKELNKKETEQVELHIDLCPSCQSAIQAISQTDDQLIRDSLTQEDWPEIEEQLDNKVHNFLHGFAKSGGVKSSTSFFLDKFYLFIKENLTLPKLAYATAFASLCLGIFFTYAFMSRPDYFYLVNIEYKTYGQARSEASPGYLAEGQQALADKKYTQAIQLFKNYLNNYPEHYQANLETGVALLFLSKQSIWGIPTRFDKERVHESLFFLTKALQLAGDNLFYVEESLWYLGQAHLAVGEIDKAKKYFTQITSLQRPGLEKQAAALTKREEINALQK